MVTEYDIIRDEQERSHLLRAIAGVETAIASSTPSTRRVLENTLENAKRRVAVLDKTIEQAKAEHVAQVQAQATRAAALAAKESKLSAEEKETYRSFLKEEFFTKNDFGKLAEFYAHTWDRLSEGGKDEMSHRIWEGVRRHAYKFSDLPENVRGKEEDRLYAQLIDSSRKHGSLEQIPEADRNDFINALKAGDRKKASEVLNRESFRRNVSVRPSEGFKHQSATANMTTNDAAVLSNDQTSTPNPVRNDSSTMAKIKSASEKLKDLTLDDASSSPTVASMPTSGTSVASVRSPV